MTRSIRVALDIGGVISKYPDELRALARTIIMGGGEIHVITDMQDRADVLAQLVINGFDFIDRAHVHCADYKTHGEGCKAELLAALKIDIILDDFIGYVAAGGAPIRCLVMPDAHLPYWHPTWKAGKADGASDFGRRTWRKAPEPADVATLAEALEAYATSGAFRDDYHAMARDVLLGLRGRKLSDDALPDDTSSPR